jgi:membrane fusion protein, multidrug efflux system
MSTPNPLPVANPAAPVATAPKLPRVIGAATVIVLGGVAAYVLIPGRYSESTDDAYVEAHLTRVTAKVPAYVQALHVDDNTAVKTGELLVELDPRDYAVAVKVAHANLDAAAGRLKEANTRVGIADADAAEARAELSITHANAVLAEANLERIRSVSDVRAVSTERVDTATAAAESTRAMVSAAETKLHSLLAAADLARAQVKTTEASVAQSQAALDQAQLNLSYTKITAVLSGTIADKTVEEGNYVQPGETLFALVPEAPYVIANFKETQLQRMKPGQAARVRVDAYPHLRLKGHIDSLQRGTGSVFALLPPENATGNFVKVVQRVPVKIVFDDLGDAARWISPGMSVEVQVRVVR